MSNTDSSTKNVVGREQYLRMLDAAVRCKAYRFGRQAALSWLAVYPGDLEVMLLQAELLAGDAKEPQALALLDKLLAFDPEYADAHQAVARIAFQKDEARFRHAISCMKVLGETVPEQFEMEEWVLPLLEIRRDVEGSAYQQALEKMVGLLGIENVPLLVKLEHLRLISRLGDVQAFIQLSDIYMGRHVDCVEMKLTKASALMELGNEPDAVFMLHQCVSLDSSAQVARRLWGKDHPYKAIWPEKMEVLFDIALPAEVSVELKGAWLPVGERVIVPETAEVSGVVAVENPSVAAQEEEEPVVVVPPAVESAPTAPEPQVSPLTGEELAGIEAEFRKVARNLKQAAIGRSDGRFPAYVLFSSKKGLTQQYGPQTTEVIDLEMRRLAESIRKRTGWDTIVFYPDDAENAARFGLTAVQELDPWKFKLALADLDKTLGKKGEMIGMMLIVGGPQAVPFHELPNPTDDFDEKVLSDNPYATLGSNYFVPEWPVGRLPGATGPDAGLLLEQLRYLIGYHGQAKNKKSFTDGSVLWPFLMLFEAIIQALTKRKDRPNVGYTAAVWRRSSTAVFRPIGNPANLMVSPPQDSQTLPVDKLLHPEVAYYNLHGLEDSGEWYGQRDPAEPVRGPDYPVALTPKQVVRNGYSPRVIFSEACYGGNVVNKNEENALSLKFLSLGTLAMIGSTCIAYGAITPPLVAADLLGNYFWQQMKSGRPAGEALMIAKIEMSREMIRRQGYLDAEDQKTLLSFVLYGDPLVGLSSKQKRSKSALRLKKHPKMKTIEEKPVEAGQISPVSFKVLDEVKQKLASYLPGIDTAEIHIHSQEGGMLVSKRAGKKTVENNPCYVVTVSKQVPFAKSIHRHYARATVAPDGRVIKLAVSR